jgi:L-2,4-diaminobutyric acid acetyltransferase
MEAMTQAAKPQPGELRLRPPELEDGAAVWELIRACGPLDDNSMYCNFLQCDHFADTCVVAELDGEIVGWVSGYILPAEPETLFVWQVAVSESARGMGVAKSMLTDLINRDACADATQLKTTITRDNRASWALFGSLADEHDAMIEREAHLKKDEHFDGRHPTEYMVTIADLGIERRSAA